MTGAFDLRDKEAVRGALQSSDGIGVVFDTADPDQVQHVASLGARFSIRTEAEYAEILKGVPSGHPFGVAFVVFGKPPAEKFCVTTCEDCPGVLRSVAFAHELAAAAGARVGRESGHLTWALLTESAEIVHALVSIVSGCEGES
jgi:hypothetical protein